MYCIPILGVYNRLPRENESKKGCPQMIRPTMKANDFVSWPTLRGQAHGRIQALVVHGTVGGLQNFKGFTASQESPVARILVYEQLENGFRPTEESVYRHVSNLSPIDKPKAALVPLIEGKKKADKTGEICIYSDIGSEMWGGVSSKMFKKELDALDGVQKLEVRINSGGGDAFEGLAMHNMIRQFKCDSKIAYVDALCASAATVVALGAQTISMADESWFMIHRSATFAFGNANDIAHTLELLQKVDQQLIRIYDTKTSLGTKKIEAMLDDETWMTAQEAVDYGFVDEITAPAETRIAASLSRKWFKNPPQANAVANLPSEAERSIRAKVAQQARYLKSRDLSVA